MKKLYLCIMLLLCLAACDREEDGPAQLSPAIYRSVRLESNSSVKLFSRGGEIKDSKVIARFAEKYGENILFLNGMVRSSTPTEADSIQILTPTEAVLKDFLAGDKAYTVKKSNELVEFISKDTTSLLVGSESSAHALRLFKAFFKHTYAYEKVVPIPGPSGMLMMQKVVEKRVALAKADRLHYPWINYVLINNTPGYTISGNMSIAMNNELKKQPDFSQLKANDTIAFQTFELIFEKF